MLPPPTSPVPAPASAPAPAGWWRRRVLAPVLGILRQGLAPGQLALTVALGVVLGIVPLLGITTALAAFTALRLRLNVAALQLVCHLCSPLQLLLLIPLLRQGARLLGGPAAPDLTITSLQQLIAHDWRAALSLLWRAELGALALWALAGVPLAGILYVALKPVFSRVLARQATDSSQPAS